MARGVRKIALKQLATIQKTQARQREKAQVEITIKKINVINQMLRALKKSDLYEESLAVENLFSYLSANTINVERTKGGYVSLKGIQNKSMVGINKAIDNFFKNPTHTVKGMKQLYKNRKEELSDYIDDEEFVNKLSYDDLKKIYSVFQSNAYERTSRSFDSKSFFTVYTQAIDEKWNKQKFMREVEHYIDYGNDEDLKEDIQAIYDDYIKNYAKRG